MGNTETVPSGDSDEEMNKTTQLAKEFKEHVCLVDNAVTGLARATDSITAACELFLQQGNITNSAMLSNEDTDSVNKLEMKVLMTMNAFIYDSKIAMLESVKNFLFFLVERSKNHLIFSMDDLLTLEMSKYLKEHSFENKETMLDDFKLKTNENMKREISFLRGCIASKNEEITNLNLRLASFTEENNLLLKSNQDISKQLSQLKDDSRQADVEHSSNPDQETVLRPSNSNDNNSTPQVSCQSTKAVYEKDQLQTDPKELGKARQQSHIYNNKTHDLTSGEHTGLFGVKSKLRYERDQQANKDNALGLATVAESGNQENVHEEDELDIPKNKNKSSEIQSTSCKRQEHLAPLQSQNENNVLSKKHDTVMNKTKCVLVQVCYPITPFHSESVGKMLLSEIREHLAIRNVEMKTRICAPQFEEKDSPVLIMCDFMPPYKDFNKSPTIQNVLQCFTKGISEEMAVVIFYNSDENDVYKAIEKTDAKSNSSLRICHIGYSKTLYKSSLNSTALDNLVGFIMKYAKLPQHKKNIPSYR